MPDTRDQVRQRLQALFSQTFQNSAYFETYVNIGSFLSDPEQYHRSLIELEMRLEDARGERIDAIKEALWKKFKVKFETKALLKLLQGIREQRHTSTKYAKEIEPYVPYAKYLYSKLLSSVLFEWESKNGFTLDPKGKVDILFGNPGKLFNDQLKAGKPFKDVGAGKEHGEFTHRIQWFMVGVGLQLPDTGAVYRDVARWLTPNPQTSLNGYGSAKRYLWEFLFDRDGDPSNAASVAFGCTDKYDFRAPSNLVHFLMAPKSGAPILSWCIGDRFAKRATQLLTMEYIAKKAPQNPDAQKAGQVARGLLAGKFDPETDKAILDRVQKGLFIRRGEAIVDIEWQS